MNVTATGTKLLATLAGTFILAVSAGSAWAHHPTIRAEAECVPGTGFVIDYTSTSWQTTGAPGSGNTQIDILFDGSVVDSDSYDPPTYSFSGTAPAPGTAGPGDTVVVTASAVDSWDNGVAGGQSNSVNVTLPSDPCAQPNGRFTGGGRQIRVDGVRITRGLTIHCDLLLSNNLQVNWPGGNRFHMTEHLTTVQCSDDPEINQFPPAAPLDTLIGVGTGRYNNEDGFTIEFTLVDGGEPGRMDEMAILIYETANPANVVLDVPQQRLDRGNLQAHFDQPHK